MIATMETEIQSFVSTPIVLSDFQRYLTINLGMTTTQALELCHNPKKHDDYLAFYRLFEESTREDSLNG